MSQTALKKSIIFLEAIALVNGSILGIIGGIYILVSTALSAPVNSLVGIAITLAGLPVFYYLKKKSA